MAAPAAARVDTVRRFNRFYTRQIGALRAGLLDSAFSLAEARLLYELAHRTGLTAAVLARELGLDAGYLSRLLRRLERRRLIVRKRSASDARQSFLSLTGEGRRTFATLDTRASAEVRAMLGKLPDAGQRRLVDAMRDVERLLGAAPAAKVPCILRPHRPGDMGWVVHRHGALYAQEYGWDERFEALVAKIVARFIERFDATRERCWIAERDGEIVGAVFLVAKSPTVAQLRLLYVERHARGLGIGKRLVDEGTRFARERGYRKIVLWTNSVLHAARHIYEAAGYRLVAEKPHHSFGHQLLGQTWELKL
jgi:DNA-binding MarR family transcriptional regulator/GNAT superfamily N-acetyltransferase